MPLPVSSREIFDVEQVMLLRNLVEREAGLVAPQAAAARRRAVCGASPTGTLRRGHEPSVPDCCERVTRYAEKCYAIAFRTGIG